MAIQIKTPLEIDKMRRSGEALRQVHEAVKPLVVAGASTMDLENAAAAKMSALHVISAFKGYHGFPAVLCTSVNSEVVHGIPSVKRILADGDIISIDCGVILDGFYSDCAVTYAIGTQSPTTRKLLEVTEASLYKAIDQAQVGGRLFDISAAVQEMCEGAGFGVVKEFVGHGIGRSMHEDPQLPNFGTRGKGPRLKAGMVLAIEPMINAGGAGVKVLPDGWTTVTLDGSYSAHFEHTVAITKDGPLVLTR
ncbi:MAG TPA: type I methionyl aminopeptidase [Acidobacteriaceae bacterium]|nr:type I methionyl aminopeptidase [Acidobacteriaceae bacterium]